MSYLNTIDPPIQKKPPKLWKLLILLILLLIIIFILPLKGEADVDITPQTSQKSNQWANMSSGGELKAIPITPEIYNLVMCESSWDNSAIGKQSELGLAQFKRETFNWMSGLAGFEGSIYSDNDQLELLKWGLENGYQNHWSCFYKI